MAGSFLAGGGTLANAGNGNAASTQTGQVVTTAQSQAQANARAAALRSAAMRANRAKGGRTGTGPQVQSPWTDGTNYDTGRNAWTGNVNPNIGRSAWTGNVNQAIGRSLWTGQSPVNPAAAAFQQGPVFGRVALPTGSFFASNGSLVRQGQRVGGGRVVDRTKGTRQVRTSEDTMTEVPLEPGMGTGTFFSGGEVPPAEELPTYPTGTFFAADGTLVRGPGYIPPTETTNTDSPFTSYYTGWKGGGGGGGYDYGSKIPSWLLNLYNWNFKG